MDDAGFNDLEFLQYIFGFKIGKLVHQDAQLVIGYIIEVENN